MKANEVVNETKFISVGQLQVGDIILSTSEGSVSSTVRVGTNSKFSHARIYIGDSEVIEAIDPRVIRDNIIDLIEHDTYTYVYRYPNLSATQKSKIVEYSSNQIGKEYDLSGALSSSVTGALLLGPLPKLQNLINSEFDFFCSELVAFSYKSAGVPLNYAASQTTPRDLAVNDKLTFIGRLK
ncbi:hypothetical protein KDW99_01560 [Marinomonas rhizomae]|uniref:YiiX/YebB-like N1pC/P60 family cysteine hydrolase n=1 Tax=Marinomonas rhizomae TaxID=491948 RepID=UPI0021079475|nr:YiiX/YebB-like N1pC/P60 family cysteine hydrolase [Marinomonas rhizomae]UTV99864.1 hypothetical protein KDW99_01560 [Marinomonas rhizomae]